MACIGHWLLNMNEKATRKSFVGTAHELCPVAFCFFRSRDPASPNVGKCTGRKG